MLLTPWLKLFAARLSHLFRLGRRHKSETRFLRRNLVSRREAASLSFERLEDRTLLAVFDVNSALDNTTADEFLTLREAIEIINDGDPNDGVAGLGGRNLTVDEANQINLQLPIGNGDTIIFDGTAVNAANAIVLGGTELSVTAAVTINGNGVEETIVDGDGSSRLFHISGADFDVEFRNLTLRDGNTLGGGGVVCSYVTGTSNVTISNSIVSGNYARSKGGAIYSYYGDVTVTNSSITGNRAYNSQGGAIFAANGIVSITNSTFSGNRTHFGTGGAISTFAASADVIVVNSIVSGNSAAHGGGIYASNGNVTLTNSSVSGNEARTGDGGGILARNGNVTLTNSTVSNNTAGNDGGGIHSGDGDVTLTDSAVSGNYADSDGGGLTSDDGTVTLTGSTISGNTASGIGGGMYINSGDVLITNSTLSGNRADEGGAVYKENTEDITLVNTTVTNNTAYSRGGGVYSHGALVIHNSIIAGNTDAGVNPDLYSQDDDYTIANSLIGDNTGTTLAEDQTGVSGNFIGDSGSGGIIDPMLAPLAFNGGPTQTHALLAGSLAHNAGDNLLAVDATAAPLTNDQRGGTFTRIFNFDVDMGAFEAQSFGGVPLIVDSAADVVDGDLSDGNRSLREVIDLANNHPGANLITFDPLLDGTPLLLDMGQLNIGDDVFVTGNGAANTIIDGQGLSRIFNFDGTVVDSTLTGLTLQNGQSSGDDDGRFGFYGYNYGDSAGGAVRSIQTGTLTIADSTLTGNSTVGDGAHGGAVASLYGNLVINNSILTGNSTNGDGANGGAIFTYHGNLTITDSSVTGNSVNGNYSFGGGILSVSGYYGRRAADVAADHYGPGEPHMVTITGTDIIDNHADTYDSGAGGLGAFNANVMISGSTVSQNTARYDGGGIAVINSSLTVSQSTISDNHAGDDGGGIASANYGAYLITDNAAETDEVARETVVAPGTITIIDSTISENTAGQDGGGIAAASFDRFFFIRDVARETSAGPGTITIIDSTISGNYAGEDGGGIANYSFRRGGYILDDVAADSHVADPGSIVVVNSTISGNEAGENGGGIANEHRYFYGYYYGEVARESHYAAAGSVTVINSTISGNTAGDSGGGIASAYSYYGYYEEDVARDDVVSAPASITLVNSTVTGNMADFGGGVALDDADLHVHNSIVAANTAGSYAPDVLQGDDIRVENSLIGDNQGTSLTEDQTAAIDDATQSFSFVGSSAGAGVIDPVLGPLQHNGGPTFTHQLLDGSPAIDAGDNALAVDLEGTPLANDQRLGPFYRIFGGTVDIGAFEDQPLIIHGDTAILTGSDGDDVIDYRVGTSLLKINGLPYRLPDNINFVEIDGGEGNDTLRLFGTPGDDSALTRPEQVFFEHDDTHDGFDVTGLDVETVILFGEGGNDMVTMRDTAGNDRFDGSAIGGVMFGGDGSYQSNAFGFEITALFSTGDDLATFTDSQQSDTLTVRPGSATFQTPNFLFNVQNFDALRADSLNGIATANLFGTAGDNVFSNTRNAEGEFANMTGDGIDFRLEGFETVNVDGLGGNDLVVFRGTQGDDTLIANPTSATFMTAGKTFTTTSFETLLAFSMGGTADSAVVTDSDGDDLFRGLGSFGQLTGTGFLVRTLDFNTVRIRGVNGGVNTRIASGLNYQLLETGTWV